MWKELLLRRVLAVLKNEEVTGTGLEREDEDEEEEEEELEDLLDCISSYLKRSIFNGSSLFLSLSSLTFIISSLLCI